MTKISSPNSNRNIIERIAVFDELPDGALTGVSEISALACRSHASIWRDVRAGRLANPVKLGPNSTRWFVGDARKYLAGGK